MKLINKFNKKDIRENDVLVFEVSDFSTIESIRKFLEDLQKEIAPNVSIVCIKNGDFLSLKTEKSMNKLGWYRLNNGKQELSGKIEKVDFDYER